jgi:tRNA(Phe) wybutosine-synthesizing methylase Tyw3
MKRLMPTICLITILILSLSSCSGKVALIDSGQSNPGGRLLNRIMETDIGYYFNSTQLEMLS